MRNALNSDTSKTDLTSTINGRNDEITTINTQKKNSGGKSEQMRPHSNIDKTEGYCPYTDLQKQPRDEQQQTRVYFPRSHRESGGFTGVNA